MIPTRKALISASLTAMALGFLPSRSSASPNVSLDDPVYECLAALRALGVLRPYLGGLQPLTEQRVRALLEDVPGPTPLDWSSAPPRSIWIRALARALSKFSLFRDSSRDYSLPVRTRNIAGSVDISCERQLGRPCGDGFGALSELDSTVGIGDWVAGSIRLRAIAGSASYGADLQLARGYLNAQVDPVAVEVGRDVLSLGPSTRTQLTWGDNAPPLDHVRLSTSRPVDLLGAHGDLLRGNAVYVLGRLRAPQRYPGTLVSIGRLQFDILNNVEVGMAQMLQLGGQGAPNLGFWDFLAEHVRRKDMSASDTDTSNRRVSFDVSFRVAALEGARFYYEVAFEDWRKQFDDALRYDADHLVGVDLEAIGPGRRHGLLVEVQKTGVRSQEHYPRTTGFTNAGKVVGSPLGPDAQSIFVGGRVDLGWATVKPWLEVARFSSDTYAFVEYGPIYRTSSGPSEGRYRAGALVRVPLRDELRLEVEAMFEHASSFAFEPGERRENVGLTASVIWSAPGPLGTIGFR